VTQFSPVHLEAEMDCLLALVRVLPLQRRQVLRLLLKRRQVQAQPLPLQL
jgi:hypothetical protein